MTDLEAVKLVATLASAFPETMTRLGEAARNATLAIYRRMLLDLDQRSAAVAVQRLIASSKFMPTVAEVRAAVLEAEAGQQRPAGDAWGDVLAAVHDHGVQQSPVFDDDNTARAVAAMGWESICNSDNQIADRARFIQLYEQLAAAERHELRMPPDVRRQLPARHGASQLGTVIQNLLPTLAEPMSDDDRAEFAALARRVADNPDAAAEAERNQEAG